MKRIFLSIIIFLIYFNNIYSQCDYTIICGDTWGDTWSDGKYDYVINDGFGNLISGSISNNLSRPPIQTTQDTFFISVPLGGTLFLDYTETTLIPGVQYNEDNFVKIYYDDSLIYYKGDTNSIYTNVLTPMTFHDDTLLNCPDIILNQKPINFVGFANLNAIGQNVTTLKLNHVYGEIPVQIYSSIDGFNFTCIKSSNGNLILQDKNCYNAEYVYYKAVLEKNNTLIQTNLIAVKIFKCSNYKTFFVDGRSGGSNEFQIKNGKIQRVVN